VSHLLSTLSKGSHTNYNLWKLVDTRSYECLPHIPTHHILCDIDKTYLETRFETLLGMAKIAFETSTDKVTVAGAAELLQAIRWGILCGVEGDLLSSPRGLHFISSSPPQLREVLEHKFALDGLDWSSDTFKNQMYNLKRGRFHQVKQQVAYKMAAIVSRIHTFETPCLLSCLGDSAELDAYIYVGLHLCLSRQLSETGLQRYLEFANVEPPIAKELARVAQTLPQHRVQGIWIRTLHNYTFPLPVEFESLVRPFTSYFEVGVDWLSLGWLAPQHRTPLIRLFHNRYEMNLETLENLESQRQPIPAPEERSARSEEDWLEISENWSKALQEDRFHHGKK
jgi:hypothetical protein